MKVLCLFSITTLLSIVGLSSAADDYVYGKDPKMDAEYDISLGMAGIQQAAQDPKLLAQLFQDMQVSLNTARVWVGVRDEMYVTCYLQLETLFLLLGELRFQVSSNVISQPLFFILHPPGPTTDGRSKENDGKSRMEKENEGSHQR